MNRWIVLILKWMGLLAGLILVFMIGTAIIGNINMKQERQEEDARQKSISAKPIASPPAVTELTPAEKEKKMFREAEERGRQRRLQEAQQPRQPDPQESATEPATARLSALFSIEAHCKRVSEAVGNSYRIEQTCRDNQRKAFAELNQMIIPPEIEKYCADVGKVVGGSYQIMLHCVAREIEAKKNLH